MYSYRIVDSIVSNSWPDASHRNLNGRKECRYFCQHRSDSSLSSIMRSGMKYEVENNGPRVVEVYKDSLVKHYVIL